MQPSLKHFSITISFMIAVSISCAQTNPEMTWQHTYGGSDFEQTRNVIKTSDGNLIAVFTTRSTDGEVTDLHGGDDIWVLKLNRTGNILWQKTYGGSNDENANSILESGDGGFVIYGSTYSSDGDVTGYHGGRDNWLLKIDGSGNLLWETAFGGSNDENPGNLVKLSDGGYLTTSGTKSDDGDVTEHHGSDYYSDAWMVKFDSNGSIVWQTSIGGSNDDQLGHPLQTSDGSFLLTGITASEDGDIEENLGSYDAWIVKLSGSGELIWEKTYGGDSLDAINDILPTANGNYISSGSTSSSSIPGYHGAADVWLIEVDGEGNLLWQKVYGGSKTEYSFQLISTNDNGFLSVGVSYSSDGDVTGHHGGAVEDYWVVKTDESGNLQWEKSLGGSQFDFPTDVIQLDFGNYIVAGYSKSHDGDISDHLGSDDIWIVELSEEGDLVWERSFGGSKSDDGAFIVPINHSELLITGVTNSTNGDVTENHGNYDSWLFKLQVPSDCETPAATATTDITSSSALLNWTDVNDATGYTVIYKKADEDEWNTTSSDHSPKNITGLDPETKYVWRVKSVCSVSPLNSSLWTQPEVFTTAPLRPGNEKNETAISLKVFPDPISSAATITFSLNEDDYATLKLISIEGRKAATIAAQNFLNGEHRLPLNVTDYSAGMYLLQLKTSSSLSQCKVIIE